MDRGLKRVLYLFFFVRYGKFGHTRNSVYAVMNKRERERVKVCRGKFSVKCVLR